MDEADTDGRQNPYLRRLEEEAASYRRRIETYKQAQQQQAALVSRLQSKVGNSKKIFLSNFTQYLPTTIVML
jgi:uncharacterized protein involved in exopolysaccharide biosynthesis